MTVSENQRAKIRKAFMCAISLIEMNIIFVLSVDVKGATRRLNGNANSTFRCIDWQQVLTVTESWIWFAFSKVCHAFCVEESSDRANCASASWGRLEPRALCAFWVPWRKIRSGSDDGQS